MRKGHRRTQSSYSSNSNSTLVSGQEYLGLNIHDLITKSQQKITNKIVTLQKLQANQNPNLSFGNYTLDKFNNCSSKIKQKLNKSQGSLKSIPQSNGSDSDCQQIHIKKQKTLDNIEVKKLLVNKYSNFKTHKGIYVRKQKKSYSQIYQNRSNFLAKKKKYQKKPQNIQKYY